MYTTIIHGIDIVNKYTAEEKVAFVHGYIYAKAESAKEEGLFEDYSVKEVVTLFLAEFLNKNNEGDDK